MGGDGPSIQFMQPKEGMVEYLADGVMLNLRVDDVDAEYARLLSEGVEPAMPLEDTKSLNHFPAQFYQRIAFAM